MVNIGQISPSHPKLGRTEKNGSLGCNSFADAFPKQKEVNLKLEME